MTSAKEESSNARDRDTAGPARTRVRENAGGRLNGGDRPGGEVAGVGGRTRRDWIRIFALLQTLFYTTGFMSVFVDLIAVQCFTDDPRLVCAALPQWIDGLETWSRIARSALLSIAPILLLAVIYWIARRARGEYDPDRLSAEDAEAGPGTEPDAVRDAVRAKGRRPPLLAAKGFWRESRIAYTTERAHFAGVIALVLFLLAYDALVEAAAPVPWPSASASGDVGFPDRVTFFIQWLGQVAPVAPWPFWMGVVAAILLVASAAIVILGGLSGSGCRPWRSVRSRPSC